MQLSTYLRALRKSWWIVLVLVVLGTLGGAWRNERATPVYASSLTFYVSTPSDSASQNSLSDDQFAERRANSYVALLSSQRLAELVLADTKLNLSAGAVMGRISASAQLNTVMVKGVVKDTSKARALRISTAIATEFPKLVDVLDNRGSSDQSVRLDVVSGPTTPGAPISPRKSLNLGLGFAVGLLLGLILAVARELADTNVRTVSDAESQVGRPSLGTIPYDSAVSSSPLIIGDQAHSSRAESLRQIRTNLQFVDVDRPPRVLVVTSSTAVEGKSTTATNLALAFAEADLRVVLVEADLRRPRVTDYMGIERTVGLSNVLAGQVSIDDVLQIFGDKLHVLPSGPTPPNAASMVGSERMSSLVATLRQKFDMVIIDTPPLLPVTDAALIATVADGVVMVIRHGRVSRVQLSTARRSLEAVNANVVGFVLNMIPKAQAKQYGGRYDGYRYREDDQKLDTESSDADLLFGDPETDDIAKVNGRPETDVDTEPPHEHTAVQTGQGAAAVPAEIGVAAVTFSNLEDGALHDAKTPGRVNQPANQKPGQGRRNGSSRHSGSRRSAGNPARRGH